MRYLIVLLLAGCAAQPPQEYEWDKPGASPQEFAMDRGQCQAQAFGAPGMPALQVAMIFGGCMQGKGWQSVPK